MTDQLTFPGMKRSALAPEPSGDDLKRRGMEQALMNERALWRRIALEAILEVAAAHRYWNINDVRQRAKRKGLAEPHHPNVWGAMIRMALQMGVMVRTGSSIKGKLTSQRGRQIPVYESVREDTNG